ncbi:MAG TPA: hypothetical protein VHE30_27570 [Polyangiaceae bacterium]|nr:hypothetical protein [Polyangiaceae bacterium]
METLVDDVLRAEARRFRLRFGCEHCAHHEVDRGRCAEGFPNDAHRDVHLEATTRVVFCKSFELA